MNNTQVHIMDGYRGRLGNVIFEDAEFFGRPNFRGETNAWGSDSRILKLVVPDAAVDALLELGWNVKTTTPEKPEIEPVSFIKIAVDDTSVIVARMDDQDTLLTKESSRIIDSSRNIETMDVEFRAWEYEPGLISARLVKIVVVMLPDFWANKYGSVGV